MDELQQLRRQPNKATHQLLQIRRTENVITAQRSSLSKSQARIDVLGGQYEKLLAVTRAKRGTADIQRIAEQLDQDLRVLEGVSKLLAENRRF